MRGSDAGPTAAGPPLIALGVLLALLALAIVAGWVLPGPAALMAPAALQPVEGLITVDGASAEPAGHFYLSTLHLSSRPRLGQYLLARLQSDVEAVPRSQVLPPTLDEAEFQRQRQRLLTESQCIAEIVALRQAKAPVTVHDAEVRVVATIAGTPAALELQPGDVIEAVDGETVRAAAELVSLVQGHVTGEPLTLRVNRSGRTRSVTLPALRGPLDTEGPVLGTVLATAGLSYQAPVSIGLEAGQLPGGPSSALMYALGVFNALVPEDITRGYRIAGTGTLRLNGTVGPVDGVRLKVWAAEQAGAEYFLAPADDAAAANAAARSIKIISVRSFGDAVSALRKIDMNDSPGLQIVPARGDTTLAWLK
ncbi:MAG TPA: PDZ domain-containing protein [Anaerolineae bacterium]|nr:PDZ domain-containing protein [Anaerolineae bacterium]HOQ98914.1 PDZ domain-containing protein [Anaerolineae bacterium]HPL26510.1 PDZ domain-containing protein [Anaerolineae bacterium]